MESKPKTMGNAAIYGQADYRVRFDWGLDGASAIAHGVDAVVVVDVLSFTTAVSVATTAGASVFPYRWRDATSETFAASNDAVLAGKRSQNAISLSPVSLSVLKPNDRIVLPSPNGATICTEVANQGGQVIAGALRNASAVAKFINENELSVAVIAGGEHWQGSSGIRPCFEDLVGAGAILSALNEKQRSPEAQSAVGAFRSAVGNLEAALFECAGGRELAALGYPGDVAMASALDADGGVPLLTAEGCFVRK